MADWDDEDFDPEQGFTKLGTTDRWEGEDEAVEVKDTWEESDEEKKDEDKPQDTVKAVQVKKKKSIEATLKAKEEKRKQELSAKTDEQPVVLSKEEQLAEKLRQQKLQEDSDLELAKEAFGVTDEVRGGIDNMQPTTPEEFEEFAKLLQEKLQELEKSPHYVDMLDNVFQGCSLSLEADQVKRLGTSLTAIANEKAKVQQKAAKSKKKSKKAALAGSGKSSKGLDDKYDDGGYNDMDDFI